jgi:signal transduction histidine kinase
MIKKITLFFFLFLFFCVSGQNIKSINAVNSIPFEEKLKKAATLDIVYLKNAIDAERINYELGVADSYSNLSLVYYYQGKYEKDLRYSLKAISIYEKINNTEKLALEYGELGYRMKRRNMQKALFYLQKAKSISEQNKLQQPLLSIYNNYGVLKEMQTQYDSALYFYNKGLVLKESIKDSIGIPYSLNNIAGVYTIKKLYNKALPLYERALKIRILKNDQTGITENFTYFGDLFFAEKDFKTSIIYFEKSLNNALKNNYIDLIQYSYKRLSENQERLNNSDEALKNYKKYTQFKDSLINKETNSKIAELEVKFETDKKEKLLLQKEIEAKKKNTTILILSIIASFIGLLGFLIYRQQKLKNKQQEQEFELKSAISKIETQNKLHEQRLSISRDLHDNIGAQLTFVISSIDNLKFGNKITDSKVNNQLTKISDFTKSTIIELRDTIWAMNTSEFTVEDLYSRILNFIEKAKSAKDDINFKFQIDEQLKAIKFSSVVGINLYRTIQEAINNAIKYSDAKDIIVDVKKNENQIKIIIQDNGKGFDIENTDFGNGLYNMKKRIEEINGEFQIDSKPSNGTTITIHLIKNQ